MAERKLLFSLHSTKFHDILDYSNWPGLQEEFKTEGILLSQSLLIWEPSGNDTWLLADFANGKTYDIEWQRQNDAKVWSPSSNEEKPTALTYPKTIVSRLKSAQGTDLGFIDLLRKLNLDRIDFSQTHLNLLDVYRLLQEILTFPRELLLNLSRRNRDEIVKHLEEFCDIGEKSKSHPDHTHTEVNEFCKKVETPLVRITTYLSAIQVKQLGTKFYTTIDDKLHRLETTNKWVNENEAERQQEFDRLTLEWQNQLAKESVSQYKAVFEDQARKYRNGARIWLITTITVTVAFIAALYWLPIPKFLVSQGNQLTAALQGLFAKGLMLSPVYVWLNRSIKNFTAQKHLEVINTHRQKALDTFDGFVAAAGENRETRDAVLLAATEAIFDADQTGYLSTKGGGSDSRSPVQQVIREIIPQKSSTKES